MGPVFLSEVCLCLQTDLSPCVWVFKVGNAATLSSGGGRADGFHSVPASDELRTATSIHMHSWEQNWAKLNFVSPKMESFSCRRWQVFVMYCMWCVCVCGYVDEAPSKALQSFILLAGMPVYIQWSQVFPALCHQGKSLLQLTKTQDKLLQRTQTCVHRPTQTIRQVPSGKVYTVTVLNWWTERSKSV